MALLQCDECGGDISSQSAACVHCGAPISEQIKNKGDRLDSRPEQIIATHTYSMVKAAPLWFLLCLLLCFSCGAGIIILAAWSLIMSPRPTLAITNRSLIYKDSHFKTTVIPLKDIASIKAGAGPFQKLTGSGYLIIKKQNALLPIPVNGLSNPESIKNLILKNIA